MQPSSFHFLPPWFLVMAALLGLLVVVLQIGILGYAYEKMGISRRAAYAILFFSLAGAGYNVPIAELPGGQAVEMHETVRWGTHYVVPMLRKWPATTLAVNVGGAIIPTLLSIYLVVKNQIYGQALVGISIVSVVVYMLAEPVEHLGIAVPIFIPPVLAAVVAMLLSRDYAAPLAYVSGCMGTLVGADLLNLKVLSNLGASVASIGGAGTFDGVFLTGILAVLLALVPRRPAQSYPSPAEMGYREASTRQQAVDERREYG
jgi:uncharacterized membrane protein